MAYADHHMAQMCHISGLHFLEDNDFFAALGAFGNACKLDPANGLFMHSFRNAAVAYNISRAPTMDVLLYDQAPEPFSVAAVPSFIEGLTSYLEGDYLTSIRLLTTAKLQDRNAELVFYIRTAAQYHLAAIVRANVA